MKGCLNGISISGNLGLLDFERGTSILSHNNHQSGNSNMAQDQYIQGVVEGAKKHTTSPTVTGTSVLGIHYRDGLMLATDLLASYGSLARYRNVERVFGIGEKVLIGTSGEYSDHMAIREMMERLERQEFEYGDSSSGIGAEVAYQYLVSTMYGKRTKMDPLWNKVVLGGFAGNGEKFLGYVDLLGTRYESECIATGFGAYIALPILRRYLEQTTPSHLLEESEARKLMEDCMRVLYYRDARSLDRIQISTVTRELGVQIGKPYKMETDWEFGRYVTGYGGSG